MFRKKVSSINIIYQQNKQDNINKIEEKNIKQMYSYYYFHLFAVSI